MNIQILSNTLLLIAVSLEVVADVLLKQWATKNQLILILSGLLLYIIATIIWAIVLRYSPLSKSIVLFTLGNLILVILAGIMIFREHLSWLQITGIALGIASIILLEI